MATTPSVGTTRARPPVLPRLRHGGHGRFRHRHGAARWSPTRSLWIKGRIKAKEHGWVHPWHLTLLLIFLWQSFLALFCSRCVITCLNENLTRIWEWICVVFIDHFFSIYTCYDAHLRRVCRGDQSSCRRAPLQSGHFNFNSCKRRVKSLASCCVVLHLFLFLPMIIFSCLFFSYFQCDKFRTG
jgi:hypothetical protein